MRPKIQYFPNFVDRPDFLFSRLMSSVCWDRRMRARRTASFGLAYNYSGMCYPDRPMPAALTPLLGALQRTLPTPVTNCLMNQYDSGRSTMGFHFDSFSNLLDGSLIAVVSLGDPRAIRFRLREDRTRAVDLVLQPGSMMTMDADVQRLWTHGMPRDPRAGPRISLSFRSVRAPR